MYTLVRPQREPLAAPELDPFQRAVVDHPGGPLLVLAGPGTGKTTTLVESVVDRIVNRGVTPDRVLVLTFSRKAAADLRTRIAARQGRSVVTPMVLTFHAFCYALVRRFADSDPLAPPLRLLTAPEQEFRIRETLAGSRETRRVTWPDSLDRAFGTRAFASEVRSVVAKARQLGMDPEDIVAAGTDAGRPEWVAVGEFFEEYLDVLDAEQVVDYAELVHRSRILLADPEIAAAPPRRDRRGLRRRVPGHRSGPGPVAPGRRRRRPQPGRGRGSGPVGVRVPRRRGAGHPRVRRPVPHGRGSAGARLALGETRRFGQALLAASRRIASRLALPGRCRPQIRDTFRSPQSAAACRTAGWRPTPTTPPARRPTRSPSCCGRRTCATGWPGTRWRCWSGPAGP